jgi:uncharacterized cupin superfamily protein
MSLKLPALKPGALEPRITTAYPEPYASQVLPREKRALGRALGLTKLGINQTTLAPGKASSMRHYHTHVDEFVYVLEGELVLVSDSGEQVLTPGTCAGFPAGEKNGHQLVNRGDQEAVFLEVSDQHRDDGAYYTDPEVDMQWSPPHARGQLTRRDGTPY